MDEKQRCQCCKNCEDCPYFQKVVNIKSAGLIIYRYTTNDCKQEDINTKKSEKCPEILILHNTKNVDIVSEKLIPRLDQYKNCPRCKYILEHAKKLLLNIPTINKFDVLGICDKCRTKDKKRISSCKCSEAIDKFITNKKYKNKEATDNKERKLRNLLNSFMKKDVQSKKTCDITKLETNFGNKYFESTYPKYSQIIERKKEFSVKFRSSDEQGSIRFSETSHKYQYTRNNYSDTELAVDARITRFGRSLMLRKALEFDKTVDSAKHEIYFKRITSYPDLTEKSVKLGSLYDETSEEHGKYRHRLVSNFQKGLKEESPSIIDLIEEQNLNRKEYITRETSGTAATFKTSTETIFSTTKYPSKDAFRFSMLSKKDELFHKDFSYVFIRETDKSKKSIQKHKSSSELIKDTQDMLRGKEEELKKKLRKDITLKFDKDEEKEKKKKIKKIQEREIMNGKEKIDTVKIDLTKEKGEQQNKDKDKGIKDIGQSKQKQSVKSGTAEDKGKLKLFQRDKEADQKSKPVKKEFEKVKEDETKYKTNAQVKDKKIYPEKHIETREVDKNKQDKMVKETHETIKDQGKNDKEMFARGNEGNESEVIEPQKKEKLSNDIETPFGAQEQQKSEKNIMLLNEKRNGHEEAELKLRALRDIVSDTEMEIPIRKSEHKIEESHFKELNVNKIKINKPSQDNLIELMQQIEKDRKLPTNADIKIPPSLIAAHRAHKPLKVSTCAICNNSELELEIEEIILGKGESLGVSDIIIGQKICKYKLPLKSDENKNTLPIFVTTIEDDLAPVPENLVNNTEKLENTSKMPGKYGENELPKGVIRYALSDRSFIEKGWTMLPTEKVVRKMNVYRMRPAHPEFDWFEHNKDKKIMHYDTGEKLAEFDGSGRGRLYYRSGRLALDYYDAEEINAHQRFVIHSTGELDARGYSRPLAILATFDYLGNGIVFDHTGKIRLKYNQTEGVVLDRSIGPVSHWKWHTLNDPPVLQQVMIDTQMAHKDPDILKLGGPQESKPRQDNEEMLAIEFDNFIKEKSKKLSQKFKPFQIKMKALKINEYFSLRVLDQATVYLIYRDGSTNIKINLGMILDHQEIVDTDTAEVGEVSNSLERFPARTDSLAGLQNSVAYAQRIERARVERERRIRPTQPLSSTDKLTAATSRPLRAPLHIVTSESTVVNCRCRKPPPNNLYYDTRFI